MIDEEDLGDGGEIVHSIVLTERSMGGHLGWAMGWAGDELTGTMTCEANDTTDKSQTSETNEYQHPTATVDTATCNWQQQHHHRHHHHQHRQHR